MCTPAMWFLGIHAGSSAKDQAAAVAALLHDDMSPVRRAASMALKNLGAAGSQKHYLRARQINIVPVKAL